MSTQHTPDIRVRVSRMTNEQIERIRAKVAAATSDSEVDKSMRRIGGEIIAQHEASLAEGEKQ